MTSGARLEHLTAALHSTANAHRLFEHCNNMAKSEISEDLIKFIFWSGFCKDLRRRHRWVEAFRETVESIKIAPSADALSMFWIRLYGLVHEMWESHRQASQLSSDTFFDSDGNEYNTSSEDAMWATLAQGVLDVCQQIRDRFTPDELLFILWKRDHAAHIELSGYEPRIVGNKVNWYRRSTPIGSVHHDQIQKAVATQDARGSELDTAREYANRIELLLDDLLATLNEYPEK